MTAGDLTTRLLPVLQRSLEAGFNVFDVMHHGTHEKQLSNVFRWPLEIGATHNFGALGQQVFINLIKASRGGEQLLSSGPYAVRQEVNTSEVGEGWDIADIVLESDTTVVVVENYEISDGHGHGYDRYLHFGEREGRTGVIVLLCAAEDRALLTGGWQHASVITYEQFLEFLVAELDRDPNYEKDNAEQRAFIDQLHRKYVKGKNRMSDGDVLAFVAAMCATGEAKRYQEQNQTFAAERFASDLAQQARETFGEGREVLQRVKARLRLYGASVLSAQLNESFGAEFVAKVSARYSGVYQWTINFETGETEYPFDEARLQIKFGPSAWYANEQDKSWERTVPPGAADYSRLFITRARNLELRQSAVSLDEVLHGLDPDDTRLRDEMIALVQAEH